jgi:PAS domain-containing protein
MDHFSEGIMLVNMGTPQWDITFVNDAWSQLTGVRVNHMVLVWDKCP